MTDEAALDIIRQILGEVSKDACSNGAAMRQINNISEVHGFFENNDDEIDMAYLAVSPDSEEDNQFKLIFGTNSRNAAIVVKLAVEELFVRLIRAAEQKLNAVSALGAGSVKRCGLLSGEMMRLRKQLDGFRQVIDSTITSLPGAESDPLAGLQAS
jgi:hypothetical protein